MNNPPALRIVTVTVEMVTEDGEIHTVPFVMDPRDFKVSQHRHLVPQYDDKGHTTGFRAATTSLVIRGTLMESKEG